MKTFMARSRVVVMCVMLVSLTTMCSRPERGGDTAPPTSAPPASTPIQKSAQSGYTLADIRAKLLTPGDVGSKYRVRDLNKLRAPYWNPHAFDEIKNPRSVLTCYGRRVLLSGTSQVTRSYYYRILDGANDNYVQRYYFVVAAVYDDPAALAADFGKLRNANCPDHLSTPRTPIPSKLPRDRWWFHPPTKQTWRQSTGVNQGWTHVHALQGLSQPRWVGVWQQHIYTVNDYLMRQNALIAVIYSHATPDANSRPITDTANRLLGTLLARLG